MGRSWIAPEVFNCNAPDTGNMETLVRYANGEQKKQWLVPLLAGEIRSAFAMTEPDVASSDATNIEASIVRDGDHYVINGRKWWTTGGPDPRCKIMIFMGKTDAANPDRHQQQSMILIPVDTPGVKLVARAAGVRLRRRAARPRRIRLRQRARSGDQHPAGRRARLRNRAGTPGPGRIHHCMRLIGQAERSLDYMCRRAVSRVAFGRAIADQTVTQERIANARIAIDQARLLVLHAAWKMDVAGNKAAKKEIAMIKVAAPVMACQVIDWAMQVHGAAGVSDDFPLAFFYAQARTLRFADGPDEVHRNQIAKLELAEHRPPK